MPVQSQCLVTPEKSISLSLMHNRFGTRAQIPLGKAGRKNNNINIWQRANGLCPGEPDFSSFRTGLSWETLQLQIRSKIKVPSESVPREASFRRNPSCKESNCRRGACSFPRSDFVSGTRARRPGGNPAEERRGNAAASAQRNQATTRDSQDNFFQSNRKCEDLRAVLFFTHREIEIS